MVLLYTQLVSCLVGRGRETCVFFKGVAEVVDALEAQKIRNARNAHIGIQNEGGGFFDL